MLLAEAFLPCVKDLDKFHEPPLVALAPPTYVLRVWIESLHICIDLSCGRDGPLKRDTNRSAPNIPSLAPLLVRYHLKLLSKHKH